MHRLELVLGPVRVRRDAAALAAGRIDAAAAIALASYSQTFSVSGSSNPSQLYWVGGRYIPYDLAFSGGTTTATLCECVAVRRHIHVPNLRR